MRYLVYMVVRLRHDMNLDVVDDLKAREKELCLRLQRSGARPQIWRVVGQYVNYTSFDIGSHDELHETLSGPPLIPGHRGRPAGSPSFGVRRPAARLTSAR